MSVLDRDELSASPLADLHAIASELGLDGFRRLRKDDLIERILAKAAGEEPAAEDATDGAEDDAERTPRRRRGGRGGRGRSTRDSDPDGDGDGAADDAATDADADAGESSAEDDEDRPKRSRRSRGGRGRSRTARDADAGADGDSGDDEDAADDRRSARDADEEERVVTGTVELLGNGSGFVRVTPPDPSDEDVYISAAQVRRCELVSGDTVAGPVRRPRRSERYPSLVRIDSINGRPADEVAEGTRFDELPAAFPSERISLGSDDPTVKAVEWLTPFGRGSRVTITGPSRAGKSEAIRRIAAALAASETPDVAVVLAGVRPEEATEWRAGPIVPVATASFAESPDAQVQAVERGVEQAKRLAARGGNAIVLIDSLDGLPLGAQRRALAGARNIVDGGSVTVIATASAPVGGETTVIALDLGLASTRRFPAIDLLASGTHRPELLVGEAGAEAIAKARADAL